jgi:2-dehydro-3-deoxyphosphogluconate aldolase / (4S)-4-hydroxy-2-oxoglutarate aldolase
MPIELLRCSRVLPVLVIDDPAGAVPLAIALRDAGICCLEVTLRRPGAIDAIRSILAEVDGVSVGAGTVTTPEQLDQLQRLGAAFAVSPGTNPALVRRAQQLGLPYLPGVITPSEVMTGLELGVDVFKYFPAGAFGGVGALRAYADVFAGAQFCPTGGIGLDNAADYLALPNVVAVGSSWLAPAELVNARDWRTIGERASALLSRLAPIAKR